MAEERPRSRVADGMAPMRVLRADSKGGTAGESVLGADRLAGGLPQVALPRVALPFGRERCGCAQGRERAAS